MPYNRPKKSMFNAVNADEAEKMFKELMEVMDQGSMLYDSLTKTTSFELPIKVSADLMDVLIREDKLRRPMILDIEHGDTPPKMKQPSRVWKVIGPRTPHEMYVCPVCFSAVPAMLMDNGKTAQTNHTDYHKTVACDWWDEAEEEEENA
jgi:hypothetical protein